MSGTEYEQKSTFRKKTAAASINPIFATPARLRLRLRLRRGAPQGQTGFLVIDPIEGRTVKRLNDALAGKDNRARRQVTAESPALIIRQDNMGMHHWRSVL